MLIKKLNRSGSLLKPPLSKKVRAGLVILKSGQEIGQHTTGSYEEVLIILSGKARIILKNNQKTVSENNIVYIPRNTLHNVKNTSSKILKYIYVVTK